MKPPKPRMLVLIKWQSTPTTILSRACRRIIHLCDKKIHRMATFFWTKLTFRQMMQTIWRLRTRRRPPKKESTLTTRRSQPNKQPRRHAQCTSQTTLPVLKNWGKQAAKKWTNSSWLIRVEHYNSIQIFLHKMTENENFFFFPYKYL